MLYTLQQNHTIIFNALDNPKNCIFSVRDLNVVKNSLISAFRLLVERETAACNKPAAQTPTVPL